MRSRPAQVAALALAASSALTACSAQPGAAVPTPSATATATPERPSSCGYDDVLATHTRYDEYGLTLVDTTFEVAPSYLPPDLVRPDGSKLSAPPPKQPVDMPDAAVRAIVVPDLAAMRDAATKAGVHLAVLSGYRSYQEQQVTFDYWVHEGSFEEALRTSARPGHSEHQLGTAIDFGDGTGNPWDTDDWGTTPAGAWLAAHAGEYGFVLSYPKGKSDLTCYAYEPWHYRWVGRDEAAQVRASGLTLREFLWPRR